MSLSTLVRRGATTIAVATAGTLSFAALAHAALITGVSPASGPTEGGGAVYISGKSLAAASSVTFGGVPSRYTPQVVSDTTVIAFAPAHAPGPVDVAVTTPGGTAVKPGAYTYTSSTAPLPTISSVSPQSVWSNFGGMITISGTNLTEAKTVTVGGKSAPFVAASSLTILAYAPGLPTGSYPVAVTGPNGTSAPSAAATLQYKPIF